jgi:UDP-N-acetylglucosamine acyltransferase
MQRGIHEYQGRQSMSALIDPSAKIHPSATIADNVTIGPWVMIGEQVSIGEGTRIDAHAVISKHCKIGNHNHIHSHAVVGGDPQDLSYRGEETWLIMGDHNVVREFVTLNRGSTKEEHKTIIGNQNCFLSYSHVAHDARIGNNVLFVNNASIAGHVRVDDYAIIGAYAAVHQFTRIGSYSFLVHAAQASHDIPPFMLVKGTPAIPIALNVVGLRRQGFSANVLSDLKKAFRLLYRQNLPLKAVENELKVLAQQTAEIHVILEMMQNTKRGFLRKHV